MASFSGRTSHSVVACAALLPFLVLLLVVLVLVLVGLVVCGVFADDTDGLGLDVDDGGLVVHHLHRRRELTRRRPHSVLRLPPLATIGGLALGEFGAALLLFFDAEALGLGEGGLGEDGVGVVVVGVGVLGLLFLLVWRGRGDGGAGEGAMRDDVGRTVVRECGQGEGREEELGWEGGGRDGVPASSDAP